MTPPTDLAQLERLAKAWEHEPTGDLDVIEPIIAAGRALVAEVQALREALVESPLAAEMWKQLPNAMLLHTAKTDQVDSLLAERAELVALADAVKRWAEHDKDNPLPAYRHDAELLEAYGEYAKLTALVEGK